MSKKKKIILIVIIGILVVAAIVGAALSKEDADSIYTGTGTTSSYFTNKYGTPNTQCAHSGCTRKIASSGDTNCCTIHSNRCAQCYCYIDEDAYMCMDCIRNALYK